MIYTFDILVYCNNGFKLVSFSFSPVVWFQMKVAILAVCHVK